MKSPPLVETEKGMFAIEKSSLKTYHADSFSQLKVVSRYLKGNCKIYVFL